MATKRACGIPRSAYCLNSTPSLKSTKYSSSSAGSTSPKAHYHRVDEDRLARTGSSADQCTVVVRLGIDHQVGGLPRTDTAEVRRHVVGTVSLPPRFGTIEARVRARYAVRFVVAVSRSCCAASSNTRAGVTTTSSALLIPRLTASSNSLATASEVARPEVYPANYSFADRPRQSVHRWCGDGIGSRTPPPADSNLFRQFSVSQSPACRCGTDEVTRNRARVPSSAPSGSGPGFSISLDTRMVNTPVRGPFWMIRPRRSS